MRQAQQHERNALRKGQSPTVHAGLSEPAPKPFLGGEVAQRMKAGAPPGLGQSENKTGMPDSLKAGLEKLSGLDLSDVRVHKNSTHPAQLNAHAYAKGKEIHLAPGQDHHLPHEGWHVVQQMQGRVAATTQMKQGGGSVGINDSKHLEAEADRMGSMAKSMGASQSARGAVTQRQATQHQRGCSCGSCS